MSYPYQINSCRYNRNWGLKRCSQLCRYTKPNQLNWNFIAYTGYS